MRGDCSNKLHPSGILNISNGTPKLNEINYSGISIVNQNKSIEQKVFLWID